MFWGCIVKDKKPFEIKTGSNKVLHLSEACLGEKSGEEKVYLQVQRGDEKYNLCVLQKDKWESHKLDHFLMLATEDHRPFKLALVGAGANTEIHVTGYMEAEEDEEEGLEVEGRTSVKDIKESRKVEPVKQEKKEAKDMGKDLSKQGKPVQPQPKKEVKSEDSDLEEMSDDFDMSNDLNEEDEEGDNEIEDLLNRNKTQEEVKPTKLQKLEDGAKKPVVNAGKPNKPQQGGNKPFNKPQFQSGGKPQGGKPQQHSANKQQNTPKIQNKQKSFNSNQKQFQEKSNTPAKTPSKTA